MSAYTSKKASYTNAKLFKESFYSGSSPNLGYIFIGKNIPYANESSPDIVSDTIHDEKSFWDNMYAAKRITGSDVQLVAPRINWTANTKYCQYDDTVTANTLLSTTSNASPMYVITTDYNVYLCLSNNISSNSTVQPTGQNFSANGNIITADGYIWKYLYNVYPSNKFLSNTWIPVPISTSQLEYGMSSVISVDGEIASAAVTNPGTGYIHSTITVSSFSSGCTVLSVSNTTNLAANMAISGTGVPTSTYISSIDIVNNRITLSVPTIANAGGSGNNLTVTTRVYFNGDGSPIIGNVILSGNTVNGINIITSGKNYSICNVSLYGTGTGANARAIISPKFGHGTNPALEIGATNVMISSRIGEVDSTEGGLISSNTSFRQYGVLINPYKYGDTVAETVANANTVISQTTNISLIAGSSYNLNEFVYQGSSANTSTFSGYINDQTSSIVKLTNVKGSLANGAPLFGTATNPTGRIVVTKMNPELQPYTGNIIYAENIMKTQRTDGQAENIKFVISF